jgi:carbamoyl-phosphate synthase large subunit
MSIKRVFMTGGGGAGTVAAAKFLKKSGKYRIILGDMDPLAAGFKFADESYVLPPAISDDFIPVVSDIIKKQKVDVFIPLVDEEILKSYSLLQQFPNLLLLLPDYRFSLMVMDKYELVRQLKENHIPYPETFLASGVEEKRLDFPVIVKPRRGRGSRFVMNIKSLDELTAYMALYKFSYDDVVVQEMIKGKEYTVSVVVNKKGDVLAVVPKEIIKKIGITHAAVTRYNKPIIDLGLEIQKKLHANGPFNMQLVLREDEVPVIFEINPRYSTTIALTMASGVDEIGMLIDNTRTPAGLLQFETGLIMQRYYEHLYYKEDKQ